MVALTVHALDSRVRVEFEDHDAALAEAAGRAWSRCREPRSFTAEAEPVATRSPGTPDRIPAALQRLTQQVTAALIRAQTGRLLMFHAGAVSHPVTGRSLVFVAPGGTGKTTLARTLGPTYGYLTDETVGIEPGTWRIHPYEKPLSLRTGDPHKAEVSPDQLGLAAAHPEPHVAAILLIARPRDHAADPVIAELGLLDAAAALLPESSAIDRLDRPLHVVADLLGHAGPALRVSYAEAAELLPLVAELIGEVP